MFGWVVTGENGHEFVRKTSQLLTGRNVLTSATGVRVNLPRLLSGWNDRRRWPSWTLVVSHRTPNQIGKKVISSGTNGSP